MSAMRWVFLPVAFWMAGTALAQDAQLVALRTTMRELRSHAGAARIEYPGARPGLTVAKHQLRDWIETQLRSLKSDGDEREFAVRINQVLKATGVKDAKDDQNLLGSLGDVTFNIESGFLIITTAVGIVCQYDESAYVYQFGDGRWSRIWESEQNDYSTKKYTPQHIVAVHLWPQLKNRRPDGPPFVLTLGNQWGCASSWHPVYYRIWRVDSGGSKLLVDESAFAWLRAGSFIVGSIGQDGIDDNAPVDALIEFAERSIGVHSREAIRHYLIEGEKIRRVDPVALGPRDFVDEWLTRSWDESATWSLSPNLLNWHKRLHVDFVAGRFGGDTMHCQTPDLWQVGFEPQNVKQNFKSEPEVYFLIRWRPPYHFTMMDIADKPWPRCTEEDPAADEWRTLFSTQEWRW